MAFYRFAAAAAMVCAAASAASAEIRQEAVYQNVSPEEVLALLESAGAAFRIDSSAGDTTLEGSVLGHASSVYFYDCDDAGFTAPATPASRCLGFEYRAYIPDHPKDSETINQFNAEYHYGTLWRDEDDDLALHFTVLVEGGVTRGHILASYDWWREILEDFDDFMESR